MIIESLSIGAETTLGCCLVLTDSVGLRLSHTHQSDVPVVTLEAE